MCCSVARVFPNAKLHVYSTNANPLPCWGAGMSMVAMNYQTNDVPMQLHRAFFEQLSGGHGYILKPPELRASSSEARWPPFRPTLHRVSVRVISLHQLPTRKEQRPNLTGASHAFMPELSGSITPTKAGAVILPSFSAELHTMGGFCSICDQLPLTHDSHQGRRMRFQAGHPTGGFYTQVEHTLHCIAAEPECTLLRVSVHDGDSLAAYAVAVLSQLRPGYRCFRLSTPLGVPIELACLFVHIEVSKETNVWAGADTFGPELSIQKARVETLQKELSSCETQLQQLLPAAAATASSRTAAGEAEAERCNVFQ